MPSPDEIRVPRRGRRILMLVGIAIAMSILYPLRQYETSKAQLRAMVRQEHQIEDQRRALEVQKRRLSSDAEVERLAREHLHMVRPGEVAFAITGAVPTPSLGRPSQGAHPAKQHRAWYSSFWHWLTGN